jgi:Ras family protein A
MAPRIEILLSKNPNFFNRFQTKKILNNVHKLNGFLFKGIKKDLRDSWKNEYTGYVKNVVNFQEGFDMSQRIQAKRYLECSCKTFEGVEEIFQEVAKYFSNNPVKHRQGCCGMQ